MVDGSSILYKRLMTNLMRLPCKFFYMNPILSRFSKDTDDIDVYLPHIIQNYIYYFSQLQFLLLTYIFSI